MGSRVHGQAFVSLALLLALALAGCAREAAAPSQSPQGQSAPAQSAPAGPRPAEWNVVIPEPTGGGDPLTEYGTNAQYYLLGHVLEPLLHIELLPDGSAWGVVNDLAERWSFPTPTTLLIELKRDVRFHNGETLTAEHVKYTYDALMNAEKPGRRAVTLKALGDAEIVDQYTIRWNMTAPDMSIVRSLPNLLIAPLARRGMSAEEFERQPIGTGPYRVAEWPRDGTARLEAWDGYRRGKPDPARLVIRTVPEASTRVLELLAGTAQIAQQIPIEGVATIESNNNLEVTSLKASSAQSYVLNVYKGSPPLRDKRVRQALNYAVDREAIVKSILQGRGTVMPGPLWAGYIGYQDSVHAYPYDPDKARALLTEAGYPNGFTMRWTVTQGVYAKDIEIAQAVASQLQRVGVTVNIQPTERARLLSERNEGEYDLTSLYWTMGWDPSSIFHFTLNASYPSDKLAPRYGNTPAELDEARRLFKEAAGASSFDALTQNYRELNKLMHDDAFWLFVQTTDEMWGTQKSTGWRPYPTTYVPWYDYWQLQGKQAPRDPQVSLLQK